MGILLSAHDAFGWGNEGHRIVGPALNSEMTKAELTQWQTFDIAAWAGESGLAHLINAAANRPLPANMLRLTPFMASGYSVPSSIQPVTRMSNR